MRRALVTMALLAAAATLSGCWDHGRGHDRPGYPSDHHHHYGG